MALVATVVACAGSCIVAGGVGADDDGVAVVVLGAVGAVFAAVAVDCACYWGSRGADVWAVSGVAGLVSDGDGGDDGYYSGATAAYLLGDLTLAHAGMAAVMVVVR